MFFDNLLMLLLYIMTLHLAVNCCGWIIKCVAQLSLFRITYSTECLVINNGFKFVFIVVPDISQART